MDLEEKNLKVIPKRPVTQHLEEGMMIRISSNVFKICEGVGEMVDAGEKERAQTIVLPTCPDTFLGVECTFEF